MPTQEAAEFFSTRDAPILTPEAANRVEFRTGVPVPRDLRDLPDSVRGVVLGKAVDAGVLKVVADTEPNPDAADVLDPTEGLSTDPQKDVLRGAADTTADAASDAAEDLNQAADEAAENVTVAIRDNTPDVGVPDLPDPPDAGDVVDDLADRLEGPAKTLGLVLLGLAILFIFIRAGGIQATAEAAA